MHVTPKQRLLVLAGLGAVAVAALSGPPAGAVTPTATMNVTATVQATCTVSATDMAFGAYTANATVPVDATSTITVTCPVGQTYTVGLNQGVNGSSTTARQMVLSGGTDLLNYGIFTDTGRATNWDDIGGTTTVAGTGDGTGQDITAYGRVPAGQSPATGLYEDTVTVTLSY